MTFSEFLKLLAISNLSHFCYLRIISTFLKFVMHWTIVLQYIQPPILDINWSYMKDTSTNKVK